MENRPQSEFHRYMHVEKFGHAEVCGIEGGLCHVFPKIDGTNASVWLGEDGTIQAGSRKRHLSLSSDNHNFCAYAMTHLTLTDFVRNYPHYRLFGEWLVPHTIRTYRDEAWRQFYIFDVFDQDAGEYITYDCYCDLLKQYRLDYVPCIARVDHGTKDQFLKLADQNDFLLPTGDIGEGIVIKRYGFKNRFGRTVWAKIVRSEFKEANQKNTEFPLPLIKGTVQPEIAIAKAVVTEALVDKERARLEVEDWQTEINEGKSPPPLQPRLLAAVWKAVITEELYDQIHSTPKNPNASPRLAIKNIDFGQLRRRVTDETKLLAADLFS